MHMIKINRKTKNHLLTIVLLLVPISIITAFVKEPEGTVLVLLMALTILWIIFIILITYKHNYDLLNTLKHNNGLITITLINLLSMTLITQLVMALFTFIIKLVNISNISLSDHPNIQISLSIMNGYIDTASLSMFHESIAEIVSSTSTDFAHYALFMIGLAVLNIMILLLAYIILIISIPLLKLFDDNRFD